MLRRSAISLVLLIAVAALLSRPGYLVLMGESPNVTIQQPSDGVTVQGGTSLTLRARASDPQEGDLDASRVAWRSDRDGRLGEGAEVEVRGLSVGTHEITAAIHDSAGHQGISWVRVTVERPEAVRRAIIARGDSVFVIEDSLTMAGDYALTGVWEGSTFYGSYATADGDTLARISRSMRPGDGVAEAWLYPRHIGGGLTEINVLVDRDFRDAASDSLNLAWGEDWSGFRAYRFHEVEPGIFWETLYTQGMQAAVGSFDQQDVEERALRDLKVGAFLRP